MNDFFLLNLCNKPKRVFQFFPAAAFVLVGVLGLSGCKTLRLDSSVRLDSVSAMGGGPYYSTASLPDSLVEQWVYNAEAGFGPLSPLVFENLVLVATRRGEVHLIDAERGKKIGAKDFGVAINGSPYIQKERMYVPVDIGGKRGIVAWDLRNGTRMFNVDSDAVETDIIGFRDEILFVDTGSVLHSADALSETENWSVVLDPAVPVAASPVIVGSEFVVVVNAKGSGHLIELATGRIAGEFAVDGSVYNGVTADENYIYIPTVGGRLYAVRTNDLEVVVAFESADQTVQITSAAAGGGVLFVAGSDGLVRSIDAGTWESNWISDVGFPVVAPPFVAGATVFVGTLGRTLVALERTTGLHRSEHALKGRVKSPMTVHDDALYVLSEPRFVYRFAAEGSYVAKNTTRR